MTAPVLAQAWACATCGSVYPLHEHGKAFAEKCCTCMECGGTGVSFFRGQTVCKPCCERKNFESAERHLRDATKTYEEAKAAMERRQAKGK